MVAMPFLNLCQLISCDDFIRPKFLLSNQIGTTANYLLRDTYNYLLRDT
ncbi:hypothetical protein SAMN05661012_04365 [Chitinophaga sancti]|uniref:Uncharacterized protein n=1 Tax=Chitinophaga sancti TaxID=1004 RepID=A0A1K1RX17_9BACT|nr:hypothetical protein SAMN05661012_04365 [Chitinophaga sancti]